jgi:GNAT superfamily N-acetyltransferase
MTETPPEATLPDGYRPVERPPEPEAFRRLRAVDGVAPRPAEGLARGPSNSPFAVVALAPSGGTVGTARVVGDGAAVFHVRAMVVHSDHQQRGVGTATMRATLASLDDAPPDVYVGRMADADDFCERFGFETTRPVSKGTHLRTGSDGAARGGDDPE